MLQIVCSNILLVKITNIYCFRVEEYWDPITPGLDQLVVKRQLPMLHILLSFNPLNSDDLGSVSEYKLSKIYLLLIFRYQGPNTTIPYKPNEQRQRKFKSNDKRPKKHNPSKS